MSQTNLVIHTYVQECLWFTLFVQTNRRCSGKANYKECNVYKQSLTGSCLSWFWFCWFWMTSGAGWFGGWAWALRLNGNQPAVCLHRRANGSEDYMQKIADLHYWPTHCLQDSFHGKIVDHACHLPSALHYSQLKDKLKGWTSILILLFLFWKHQDWLSSNFIVQLDAFPPDVNNFPLV